MQSIKKTKRILITLFFIIVVFLAGFSALFFTQFDNILTYVVNNYTDYVLSYEFREGFLSNQMRFKGIELLSKKQNILLKANQLNLTLRQMKIFNDFNLKLELGLYNGTIQIVGQQNAETNNSDIISVLFNPTQKYEYISFVCSSDKMQLNIDDFKARSTHIVITGDYYYQKVKEDMKLKVKISFSPEIYSELDEDLKKNILAVDENGWYSTILDYQGNPLFLKAMYSMFNSNE